MNALMNGIIDPKREWSIFGTFFRSAPHSLTSDPLIAESTAKGIGQQPFSKRPLMAPPGRSRPRSLPWGSLFPPARSAVVKKLYAKEKSYAHPKQTLVRIDNLIKYQESRMGIRPRDTKRKRTSSLESFFGETSQHTLSILQEIFGIVAPMLKKKNVTIDLFIKVLQLPSARSPVPQSKGSTTTTDHLGDR